MTRPAYRIVAATGIDQGDRSYQQDQLSLQSHARVPACLLGIVADGMGGRSGGRKAADQVLMTASQLFERFDPASDDAPAFLRRLALEAHTVIRLTGASAVEEPHSTIAAFLLLPNGQCHWLHSGDSRLYLIREDRVFTRTKDHSYVQALVDRGELSEEDAADDPRSNVLLHCLGTETPPQLGETTVGPLQPGDAIVACSDGVWHHISHREMGLVVGQLAPRAACEMLVKKSRERARGRGDNLSLIVLKLDPV